MLRQAVIIAGGKGTRFSSLSEGKPKILMPLEDIKLIDFQINYLNQNNIKNIHFCLGYQSDQILEYLKGLKLNFTFSLEDKELGTYGALYNAKKFLDDNFFVMFGDIITNFDISLGYKQFKKFNSDFHLVLRYTDHPFDSDIIKLKKNKVLDIVSNNDSSNHLFPIGNTSLFFARKEALKLFEKNQQNDIFKNYLKENLNQLNISGALSLDYTRDIGTPDRYKREIKIYKNEIKKPYKVAFIDRDGTLIQDQGNECNPKKISFNKEIIEVMKFLQDENFKIILITNQPGIAKGFFNQEKLDIFHAELQNGLINLGLKPLDDIYFCPHHPDKGYKNEIKKLKIKCKCRKPGTGMVKNAIHDHNLKYSKFIYIGDSKEDYLLSVELGIPFYNFLSNLTDQQYFNENEVKTHNKGGEIINKIRTSNI